MYKNCLIVGKFMPPHKGHEYMIRFAQNYATNVHVIVDCLREQTISPEKRMQWLKNEIMDINVYALKEFMPQSPDDCSEFWDIWKEAIFTTLGFKPDLVVAAMDYGYKLAQELGCGFIPIDIGRETFPISATEIRANIFENWDYLMDSVKPDFIKKVCLLGPESTGKSTAGKVIAKKLNTIYVPEYAKAIIEKQNGQFFKHNVEEVALAQINTEKALGKFTNKVMICDSSAITTKIYSEILFNYNPNFLEELIKNHKYDKYILFYPDIPFKDDNHRKLLQNSNEYRLDIFNKFEHTLKSLNFPYEVIKGSNREENLMNFVKELIV